MADEETAPVEEEDEKPNYPRIIALAVLLLGLTGYLYYVRVIHPPPEHLIYQDLPGIDVSGLTPAQLKTLLDVTNKTPSGYGQYGYNYTLAECLHAGRQIGDCARTVTAMVAEVKAGKDITHYATDGAAPMEGGGPPSSSQPMPANTAVSASPTGAGSHRTS